MGEYSIRIGAYWSVRPVDPAHGRLVAYICREHQRGRPLAEIVQDAFVVEHASDRQVGRMLEDPHLLAKLAADCSPEAFRAGTAGAGGV
jgi:hypothetical protein